MSKRGKAKVELSPAAKLRQRYVGRRVAYSERPGGCSWYAVVIDAAIPYGRSRLLLQPLSGVGLDWYGLERCNAIPEGRSDAIAATEPGGAAQPAA